MTRLRLQIACECLLLIIPLNIYCIGDYLATGIQWALFRYQASALGNSLIFVNRDLLYVSGGILKGSSATSTLAWIAGTVCLVAALIVLVWAAVREMAGTAKYAGILTILGGIFFFAAMLVQYGPALANQHGYSLPVGVPIVIVTGCWLVFGQDNETKESPAEKDDP